MFYLYSHVVAYFGVPKGGVFRRGVHGLSGATAETVQQSGLGDS